MLVASWYSSLRLQASCKRLIEARATEVAALNTLIATQRTLIEANRVYIDQLESVPIGTAPIGPRKGGTNPEPSQIKERPAPPVATEQAKTSTPEFPAPLRLNGRLFFDRHAIENFKRAAFGLPPEERTSEIKLIPAGQVAKEFGFARRTLGRRVAESEGAPGPRKPSKFGEHRPSKHRPSKDAV
jgi:hypothetical protein